MIWHRPWDQQNKKKVILIEEGQLAAPGPVGSTLLLTSAPTDSGTGASPSEIHWCFSRTPCWKGTDQGSPVLENQAV